MQDSLGITPGPWRVRTLEHNGTIRSCFVEADDVNGFDYNAEILGEDEYRGDTSRMLADARLIAAAPELYEIVRNLVAKYDAMPDGNIRAQLTNGDFFEAREVLRKLHEEVY